MPRWSFLPAGLFVLLLLPSGVQAQATAAQWTPPSQTMPTMPRASEINDAWLASAAPWFAGAAELTGVPMSRLRANGEGVSGTGRVRFIRFTGGPFPVAAWTDRNGDGRVDLIVFYRDGNVRVELIDVDYDGVADVLRSYDAAGDLLLESRLH